MKVKALGNINSGQYVAGDVFVIDEVEAAQLIEAGAVEVSDDEVQSAKDVVDTPAPEAQEATPPEVPLPPVQPPAASVSDQPVVNPPASPPASAKAGAASPSPTAEQIAQDVAATESKSEV